MKVILRDKRLQIETKAVAENALSDALFLTAFSQTINYQTNVDQIAKYTRDFLAGDTTEIQCFIHVIICLMFGTAI